MDPEVGASIPEFARAAAKVMPAPVAAQEPLQVTELKVRTTFPEVWIWAAAETSV